MQRAGDLRGVVDGIVQQVRLKFYDLEVAEAIVYGYRQFKAVRWKN